MLKKQEEIITKANGFICSNNNELTAEQRKAIDKYAMLLTMEIDMVALNDEEEGDYTIYEALEPEILKAGGINEYKELHIE
ncbi:MAG: hypothetical protein ACOCRX_10325, partial [Candidatus Woesearchaeota archaeon]